MAQPEDVQQRDLFGNGHRISFSDPAVPGTEAFGNGAQANGVAGDTALGPGATATGGVNDAATAIGKSAVADDAATAVGAQANADTFCTAVGAQANAQDGGNGSVAIGSFAIATGPTSTAINNGNATAINALAIGTACSANGDDSIAIGNAASSVAQDAIAIGSQVNSTDPDAITIGRDIAGNAGIAMGATAGAVASSIALGHNTVVNHADAIALGKGAATTAANQTHIGSGTSPINELEVIAAALNPLRVFNTPAADGDGGMFLVVHTGGAPIVKQVKLQAAVLGQRVLYVDA